MSSLSPKEVGRRVRKIRGGLSQSEFARRIGVPNQNGVSRYEGGRIPPPELLVKIARFGKVSVDWVLTGRSLEGASLAAEHRPAYRAAIPAADRIPGVESLTPSQRELVLKLIRALVSKNREN